MNKEKIIDSIRKISMAKKVEIIGMVAVGLFVLFALPIYIGAPLFLVLIFMAFNVTDKELNPVKYLEIAEGKAREQRELAELSKEIRQRNQIAAQNNPPIIPPIREKVIRPTAQPVVQPIRQEVARPIVQPPIRPPINQQAQLKKEVKQEIQTIEDMGKEDTIESFGNFVKVV